MKKILIPAALFVLVASAAQAQPSTLFVSAATTEQTAQEDGYKEVQATELSETIQNAIKEAAGEAFDVKKVEFNAEKELTRVTLVDKQSQNEKVLLLDKEGKEATE